MPDDLSRLLALDDCMRAYGTGLSPTLRRLLRGWDGPGLAAAAAPVAEAANDRPSNVVAFPARRPHPAREARDVQE